MAILKRKKKEQDKDSAETKTSMKDLYQDSSSVKSGQKEKDSVSKKEEKIEETQDKEKTKARSPYLYDVLISPIVTEKVSKLGAENKYAFKVSKSANKIEIAESFQLLYGVKPEKVNIINIKGKKVRFGMHEGKRKDWKKAIINLPQGKDVNIYEGI